MKRFLVLVLAIVMVVCLMGCNNTDSGDDNASVNEAPKVYNLDVSFTATVDELIDDPNSEEDVPRYAVVRPFQSGPVLVDVGEVVAKTLEEDASYTFVMEQKQNVTMIEGKAYELDTLIPLYDLKVKLVDAPVEGQTGLDAVKIEYTEVEK